MSGLHQVRHSSSSAHKKSGTKNSRASSSNANQQTRSLLPGHTMNPLREARRRTGLIDENLVAEFSGAARLDVLSLSQLLNGNSRAESIHDWDDDELRRLKYIDVTEFQSLSVRDKVSLLKQALTALSREVTHKRVAYILLGAWGLRSCKKKTKYVFTDSQMFLSGDPIGRLSERVSHVSEDGEFVRGPASEGATDDWIRSACYMCAASLRLITKDEQHLVRAWNSIQNQYRGFYDDTIAFRIQVDVDCAKRVRYFLQTCKNIKNTLAPFLVSVPHLNDTDLGLVNQLFASHMSLTGMHALRLFLDCSEKLDVAWDTLSGLIVNDGNRPALKLAMKLIKRHISPKDKRQRALAEKGTTWEYARIFNHNAFTELQTKNCLQLTAVLACIARRCGASGGGDVTNIRQIANILANNPGPFERIAQSVVNSCEKESWESDEGNSP